MKKEIRKMYLWAIIKIVFAVTLGVLCAVVLVESGDEIGVVNIITCSVLWGIVVIIYLCAGISTLIHGPKQMREYVQGLGVSEMQLEEEHERASCFGRVQVGEKHAFVNASDRFYIIPLDKIENSYIRNHGSNWAKGRRGYYYLYIEAEGLEHRIKAYYIDKKSACEALSGLQAKSAHTE